MNIQELSHMALALKEEYVKYNLRNKHKEWGSEEIYTSFVSDTGDLGRLILAKEGYRDIPGFEAKMSHELGELLWAVLVLAEMHGVDLEHAFLNEMVSRKTSLES